MLQTVLNGKSTKPGVDALHRHFVDSMKADGAEVSHTVIESMIGEKRGTARYRTVTSCWRRRIFNEFGIDLIAIPGVGFRRSTGVEQLRHRVDRTRLCSRQIGRHVQHIAVIQDERLPDDNTRHRRDTVVSGFKLMAEMAKLESRKAGLLIAPAVERQPQPSRDVR